MHCQHGFGHGYDEDDGSVSWIVLCRCGCAQPPWSCKHAGFAIAMMQTEYQELLLFPRQASRLQTRGSREVHQHCEAEQQRNTCQIQACCFNDVNQCGHHSSTPANATVQRLLVLRPANTSTAATFSFRFHSVRYMPWHAVHALA